MLVISIVPLCHPSQAELEELPLLAALNWEVMAVIALGLIDATEGEAGPVAVSHR